MNVLPTGHVFVGWCWHWDVLDDSMVGSKSRQDSEVADDTNGQCDTLDNTDDTNVSEDGSSDSDVDQFSSTLVTHTVMFKCIGVTKEKEYQDTLSEANRLLQNNTEVPVRLTPEPNNPFDSRAIAFECQLSDHEWRRIGYVVREALQETHTALTNGDILNVRFGWIKFITDWYMSGPGYFAGIKGVQK